MKICYLILAHNNPGHFERLIKAISTPKGAVFVHIDAKSDLATFSHLATENVTFLKDRVSVGWGGFSMVQATINLLNIAIASNEKYDYYCLLSGNDYPLKSQAVIDYYLKANDGREFINLVDMPNDAVSKPLTRITTYHVDVAQVLKYPVPRVLAPIITRAVNKLHLQRDYKKGLNEMKPYAGSQWWMLTRASIEHIVKFISENPKFVDFFNNVNIPDESFFQTILGNCQYKNNVARNMTFTDWSRKEGPLPAIMDDEHINYFSHKDMFVDDAYGKGPLFFARKFPDDSSQLVALIHENVW